VIFARARALVTLDGRAAVAFWWKRDTSLWTNVAITAGRRASVRAGEQRTNRPMPRGLKRQNAPLFFFERPVRRLGFLAESASASDTVGRMKLIGWAFGVVVAALIVSVGGAAAALPGKQGLIAFSSGRSGLPSIYTMRPDGSDIKRVTETGSHSEGGPAWSPDG